MLDLSVPSHEHLDISGLQNLESLKYESIFVLVKKLYLLFAFSIDFAILLFKLSPEQNKSNKLRYPFPLLSILKFTVCLTNKEPELIILNFSLIGPGSKLSTSLYV